MKNIAALLIIIVSIFLAACGGNVQTSDANQNAVSNVAKEDNKPGFTIKIDGKETKFEPTSTSATHWEASFSYPENGKTAKEKSALTTILLANYEIKAEDGKVFGNGQKVEKDGQIKIKIAVAGDKGTDYSTPIKVGEYKIGPASVVDASSFNSVYTASVYYFAEGKEKEKSLQTGKPEGVVKITKIEDNSVSGSIDLKSGEFAIKGDFSAKGDSSVK